jgi:hypothetical protein
VLVRPGRFASRVMPQDRLATSPLRPHLIRLVPAIRRNAGGPLWRRLPRGGSRMAARLSRPLEPPGQTGQRTSSETPTSRHPHRERVGGLRRSTLSSSVRVGRARGRLAASPSEVRGDFGPQSPWGVAAPGAGDPSACSCVVSLERGIPNLKARVLGPGLNRPLPRRRRAAEAVTGKTI